MSGIDEQLTLAKLLHAESVSRLQTKGAYNSVFKRKADSADGFSIDQAMSMRTMLLNGLIMIQVQEYYHGEFLVCLGLRQGADYNVIVDSNLPKDDNEFILLLLTQS
ncbi:hypothetical protein EDB81DRAFT_849620 [Dactylonectria macrodidyma]|uniref:Uncharacterized protein n=1 Tax=Dactylonectria macrodidyma TaxID=307937 RepID=A0A9P9FSD8_9HYPO|nr:hypothetical protein EDB81DRAFT_849620 [Dactylonectria macrodidyma]